MSSVFFSEVLPGNGEACRECLLRDKNGSKKTCTSTVSKSLTPDGKTCNAKKKRLVFKVKEKNIFPLPV